MGFGRTGNKEVDRLLLEYNILDREKWLDNIAELVEEGKLNSKEVFTILEKIVENEDK
jgi:hypothetical protein